jgi:hypothetical protein
MPRSPVHHGAPLAERSSLSGSPGVYDDVTAEAVTSMPHRAGHADDATADDDPD